MDGAAVSLLTASEARATLWSSDTIAERIEDLQFSLNEGACIQAATTRTPVVVPDLREGTDVARWPMFAAAVIEQTPARALFAVPLQWGPANLGVLDLYRRTPGSLDQAQWYDALSAVEVGSLMMLALRTDPDGDFDSAEPDRWLDPTLGNHRAEIHQATGMVLVQLDVSSTEALARLRAYSFAHQRLLIDVAHDVVNRRLVFPDDLR